MRILVIGADGAAGSRIVTEARARGHQVTLATRTPRDPATLAVDAASAEVVAGAASSHDIVISATRPPEGRETEIDAVTRGLLVGTARAGVRLLVVGGSSPLQVPGTQHTALDDPARVPPQVRPIAAASTRQLELLRADSVGDWVYLAPPAVFEPGRRTGIYRTQHDVLVVAADGTSSVSMEDFAIAVIDEAEAGGPARRVVAVGT